MSNYNNTNNTNYTTRTSSLTHSTSTSALSSLPNNSNSTYVTNLHASTAGALPSIVTANGYHPLLHNTATTQQNPQLLAQNKKRAAAERAAIQQKIKNNITKSQNEAKKQKENHEKTRLWEEVILPNWEDYSTTAKLRDLCLRGIPNKLRGRVWPLLVNNELGIDEQMFETLCAEAQLLFHDKMTAARSRRKKAVNRESNAYGNQLHHNRRPSNPNMATHSTDNPNSNHPTNTHAPSNNHSSSNNLQHIHHHNNNAGEDGLHRSNSHPDLMRKTMEEIDEEEAAQGFLDAMEDDDPLDADFYPKQTYILDEDAAMALESDGPYLFHHHRLGDEDVDNDNNIIRITTHNVSVDDTANNANNVRYTRHSSTNASTNFSNNMAAAMPIPIAPQHHHVDLTEEDWFENERNGSLDEETFKLVQKQLFVKPVVLPPSVNINAAPAASTATHHTSTTNATNESASQNTSPRHHNSATTNNNNSTTTVIGTNSNSNTNTTSHTHNNNTNNNTTNPSLLQQALLSSAQKSHDIPLSQNRLNNHNDSSQSINDLVGSRDNNDVASSLGSKYDPNTDYMPFDFDDDDPMVKTPIKPITTSNSNNNSAKSRGKETSTTDNTNASSSKKDIKNNNNVHSSDPQKKNDTDTQITQSVIGVETQIPGATPTAHIHNSSNIIVPLKHKPAVMSALLEEIEGENEEDIEEEDGYGLIHDLHDTADHRAHPTHHAAETDTKEKEEQEEEEEEEDHSIFIARILTPRLSSDADTLKKRLYSSELTHLILSRPTSALESSPHHNNSRLPSNETTLNNNTNTHNNKTPPEKQRIPSQTSEDKSSATETVAVKEDPPNPKFERLLRVVSLIEWDLPRTFPTLAFFHDGGVMHTGLERILLCFALYCPEIGYVQGLSFLVAMLLLQCMDEYEVFMCLTNMIVAPSRGCLQDFYMIQKSAIDSFVACFDYFFKKYLPLLYDHFQRESVETLMFLMDWHLSLFTKALPIEIAAKIWDMYLYEGEVYVFCVGLGILKMYAAKLATFSVEKISKFLLHLPETIKSDELFTHIAQINITKKQYERTRKRIEAQLLQQQQQHNHHHSVPYPSAFSSNSSSNHRGHHSEDHHSHSTSSSSSGHTTNSSSNSSSRYFSTSLFKSAMRSSMRVLRTAVSSSTTSSSSHTVAQHRHSTTSAPSYSHSSSSSNSNSRPPVLSTVSSPSSPTYTSTPSNSTNNTTTNAKNVSSPTTSISSPTAAVSSPASSSSVTATAHTHASVVNSSNNQTPVISGKPIAKSTSHPHLAGHVVATTASHQSTRRSSRSSGGSGSRMSDVDEVTLALFNAGFLSVSPGDMSLATSPTSSSSMAHYMKMNGSSGTAGSGGGGTAGMRRQTKSVNSLYDLEKAKRKQQQRLLEQQQQVDATSSTTESNSKSPVSSDISGSNVAKTDHSNVNSSNNTNLDTRKHEKEEKHAQRHAKRHESHTDNNRAHEILVPSTTQQSSSHHGISPSPSSSLSTSLASSMRSERHLAQAEVPPSFLGTSLEQQMLLQSSSPASPTATTSTSNSNRPRTPPSSTAHQQTHSSSSSSGNHGNNSKDRPTPTAPSRQRTSTTSGPSNPEGQKSRSSTSQQQSSSSSRRHTTHGSTGNSSASGGGKKKESGGECMPS